MRFRRLISFFIAPLLALAGCAPKISTPLPGGEFVRAAQSRMAESEPEKLLSDAPQAAYIDVSTIATRLPLWKLAAQLEKGDKSVQFSAIDAPETPRTLQIQSTALENLPDSLPRPAGESDEPISGSSGFERAPLRVTAREATPLEIQGRQRQEGTLESFLKDISLKQDAARADEKMRLRAELEDEIESSQRLALATLEPLLPSPAVQLEMTNLRIKLLPGAATTDIERQEAATRLAQLEAQWKAQLLAQADKRFEDLRRLLTEVPVEKREVGFREIEKTLNERAARDEDLRSLVGTGLRERVIAGFGADDTAPLSIQLPGAQLPPQKLGIASNTLASVPAYLFKNQINSNTNLLWPSAVAFAPKGSAPPKVPSRQVPALTSIQKRASALRQQALKEAAQWAKSIARRRNWSLQNRRIGSNGQRVADRTNEALQLLNL